MELRGFTQDALEFRPRNFAMKSVRDQGGVIAVTPLDPVLNLSDVCLYVGRMQVHICMHASATKLPHVHLSRLRATMGITCPITNPVNAKH